MKLNSEKYPRCMYLGKYTANISILNFTFRVVFEIIQTLHKSINLHNYSKTAYEKYPFTFLGRTNSFFEDKKLQISAKKMFVAHEDFISIELDVSHLELHQLTWNCFTQLSLTHKVTIPHLTYTYYEIRVKWKYCVRLILI